MSPKGEPPQGGIMLRIRDVCRHTGLSRSAVYRAVKEGGFPRPRKIGKRSVAWWSHQIDSHNATRPAA